MALADDLVFSQDFRTGSGGTCTSGQADTGTLSGAAPPTWDTGGLRFNGGNMNNSYVTYGAIASTADLWRRPSATPYSVFARIWNDAFPSVIVSRDTNADDGGGWQFGFGNPYWGIEKTGNPSPRWNLIHVGSQTLQGQWVNVGFSDAAVLTAGSEQIYTDGVARTTALSGAGTNSNSSDAAEAFCIGRGRLWVNGAACSFNGLIACVYVWRRALSGADFTALESDPFQLFGGAPAGPPAIPAGFFAL